MKRIYCAVLRGPAKWAFFHLYVILDIFSRYVVGWLVANRESEALAVELIEHRGTLVRAQTTAHRTSRNARRWLRLFWPSPPIEARRATPKARQAAQ